MGKCIFEDVCDKSWCRLYSFECVFGVDDIPLDVLMGNFIDQKQVTSNLKQDALNVTSGGCSHRSLKTDNCDLEKYETHITNKIEF